VAGRAKGFDGDPPIILPSGTGTLPGDGQKREPREEWPLVEYTGKIIGLIYDHFGDFAGSPLRNDASGCGGS